MDITAGRSWSERTPIRHVDPVLVGTTLLLSVVGLFMVFASTHNSLQALGSDTGFFVKKQVTWLMLGVVVLLITATFDYRLGKVYAGFFYAGMLLLLLLVRTPLGSSARGSQRWFQLFGFQFTPSEWMKIALILMLAAFLSEIRFSELTFRDVTRTTAIAAVPMVLVFLQPDIGTTIVLAAILGGIVIVAGARLRHLAVLGLAAVILLAGAFQLGIVKQYQINRLTGFLDSNTSQAAGYNKLQSTIAIGSGGVTGVGYLHGPQTNLDFVPEQHTDFIFTVVGEEFGFVGAMAVLLLFAVLIWRAIRIALLSKDRFGTYVAAGIASMFAIQMFVNVGMTLGIMPITGIPLPFVSYGGSSLLANYFAVGMLLNIHMRRFN